MRQLLQILPDDPDKERRQNEAKNKRRREKRLAAKNSLAAHASNPREATALAVIDRILQWPWHPTIDTGLIMDTMSRDERALFPKKDGSFRRALNRIRESLMERGGREWFDRHVEWLYPDPEINPRVETAESWHQS